MPIPPGTSIGEIYETQGRRYQWEGDKWTYVNETRYSGVVGDIKMWPISTPPPKYLICNGSALSPSTYSSLFTAIGYTYGNSSGNFLLPNFTDRIPVGAGNSYGTNISGGSTNSILTSHSHTYNNNTGFQSANHTHNIQSDGTHAHTPAIGGYFMTETTVPSTSDPSTGGSDNSWFAKYISGATSYNGDHNHGGSTGFISNTHYHGFIVTTSVNGTTDGTNANLPPYRGIFFIIKYQ